MSLVPSSSCVTAKRRRADSLSSDEGHTYEPTEMKKSKLSLHSKDELMSKEMPNGILYVKPEDFLRSMVEARGYDWSPILCPQDLHNRIADVADIKSYTTELIKAIQHVDVNALEAMAMNGMRYTACNIHFESILHKACRWSNSTIVKFLISNGANDQLYDDRGRLPLHDACWRDELDFEIITLLIKRNVNTLRQLDIHGYSPLAYIRRDQWLQMCLFLFQFADFFWPLKE